MSKKFENNFGNEDNFKSIWLIGKVKKNIMPICFAWIVSTITAWIMWEKSNEIDSYYDYYSWKTAELINWEDRYVFESQESFSRELKEMHEFIHSDINTRLHYEKLITQLYKNLLDFKEDIHNLNDLSSFKSKTKEEHLEKKLQYINSIDSYVKNIEQYFLWILVATDFSTNADIQQRFMRINIPEIHAKNNIKLDFSIWNIAWTMEAEYDNSQYNDTGVMYWTGTNINMDMNDTFQFSKFLHIFNHELIHAISQSDKIEFSLNKWGAWGASLQRYWSVRNSDYLFEKTPFYIDKISSNLYDEILYEGITEMLTQESLAVIWPILDNTVAYGSHVIVASILSTIDKEALLWWYAWEKNNKEIYHALERGLFELWFDKKEAQTFINLSFLWKQFDLRSEDIWSAIAIMFQLKTGKKLSEILNEWSVPINIHKTSKLYDLSNLDELTDMWIKNYLKKYLDINSYTAIDKSKLPISSFAMVDYMSEPNDIALSVLASTNFFSFDSNKIMLNIYERNPNDSFHLLRMLYLEKMSRPLLRNIKGNEELSQKIDYYIKLIDSYLVEDKKWSNLQLKYEKILLKFKRQLMIGFDEFSTEEQKLYFDGVIQEFSDVIISWESIDIERISELNMFSGGEFNWIFGWWKISNQYPYLTQKMSELIDKNKENK